MYEEFINIYIYHYYDVASGSGITPRIEQLSFSEQAGLNITWSEIRTGIPGLNQYQARINVSCSRTQHNEAGEAQTRGPLRSSQGLYH